MIVTEVDDRHVQLDHRVELILRRDHQGLVHAGQLRRDLALVARVDAACGQRRREPAQGGARLGVALALDRGGLSSVKALRFGALQERIERLRGGGAPRERHDEPDGPT